MRALNRLQLTRIVALPSALETAVFPNDSYQFRIANDELLIMPAVETVELSDPHAIVVRDGSFAGVWLDEAEALPLLSRHCEWEIPTERPAFAQGAIEGIAVKMWLENGRVLFIVPSAMAHEFEERLS